ESGAAENPLHRGHVVAAAEQALAELFAQPFLDAQVLRGRGIGARRLALEHRADFTLFVGGRFASRREPIQNVAVFYLEVRVRPLDVAAGRLAVTGKIEDVVDAPDVVAIEDHEVALGVLGEDIDPEVYVGLDRCRTGEWELGFRPRVGRGGDKCNRERERRERLSDSICGQPGSGQGLLHHETDPMNYPPMPL